jgi:hypothetical protein
VTGVEGKRVVAGQNTFQDGGMSGRRPAASRGGWHALMAHPLFSTIVILWFAALSRCRRWRFRARF